jgi:7,8-dihydropterin-6-yl-methyl-4-(beta-D-ribofuranosyl)aminobenzene 5'-phosphate synthase
MCDDHSQPAAMPTVLHDIGPVQRIGLEPVDSVEITTLMDNITDVFMPDQGPARRPGPGAIPDRPAPIMANGQAPDALIAEHGFSMLVTVHKGATAHRLLFDAGTSPDGVVENMRRLDIDPGSIEAIVCSHGHFDHTTGLDGLIRALGRANMPVLIHPHFWRQRRVLLPGIEPLEIPSVSKRALEDAGFDVVEQAQPSFLLDGSVLITGEVPRVTGYEPGFPPQQAWLGGRWEQDPLVLDDQGLIINVRGKGLVVLTGCGHAGIVNICRYARRLTGDQPLYAAMGGFHLNGPVFEPLIPRVLDDLHAMNPQVLVPAHCTGWRAQHAMSRRFGEAFVPNTVGSRFLL